MRGSAAADCKAIPAPMDSPRAKRWNEEVKEVEEVNEVKDAEDEEGARGDSRACSDESRASMMARASVRSSQPQGAMGPPLAPWARAPIITILYPAASR